MIKHQLVKPVRNIQPCYKVHVVTLPAHELGSFLAF